MIVYTAHEPLSQDSAGAAGDNSASSLRERADKVVFIKDGFAWLAAVPYSTPFWLFANRLWLVAAGYLALILAVGGLMTLYPGFRDAGWLALLALHLLLGLEGNTLLRRSLERKGYQMIGTVAGRNTEECERRFFDDWFAELSRTEASGSAAHGAPSGNDGGSALPSAKTTDNAPLATLDGWEKLKTALADLKR